MTMSGVMRIVFGLHRPRHQWHRGVHADLGECFHTPHPTQPDTSILLLETVGDGWTRTVCADTRDITGSQRLWRHRALNAG